MIYLGDIMASRMEKYSSTRRSQRNQFLYENITDFIHTKSRLDYLDKENEIKITKIEDLFNNYENYKHAKKEQADLQRRYERRKLLDLYSDLYKSNSDYIDNLPKNNQNKEINNIQSITLQAKPNDPIISNRNKDYVESLFNKSQLVPQKKEELNIKLDNSSSADDKRKVNLKIKYAVGLIFLINSIIIVFLIYKAII